MHALTIITVTYNSSRVLPNLLRPLAGAYEVIVVDNGSTDNTAQVATGFAGARVVQSRNIGYGRGANRGFAEAATPYVMLVNPDVVVTPENIEKMLAFAQAHPQVGIVGARMFKREAEEKHYTTQAEFASGVSYREWITGALMLISREALLKVGAFDENIFLFFEETDLCKRFVNAGYRLAIVEGVEAEHAEGNSSAPSEKVLKIKSWHNAWSKAYYYRKHFPGATYRRKSVGKILGSFVRLLKSALVRDKPGIIKNNYQMKGALACMLGVPAFEGEVGKYT